MYAVISAVLAFAVIGLMLLTDKWKLPIAHRVLHLRSVIAALVMCIVAVNSFVLVLNLLDKLIGSQTVQQMLFRVMPQTNVSGAFFWIITELACVVVAAAFCIVLALIYFLWLKPLSKKAYLNKKSPLTRLLNWLSGFFYDMELLEPKLLWINVGQWIRAMRNTFAGIVLAEAAAVTLYLQLGLTWFDDLTFGKLIKSLYMLPVITWFLLDQIYTFLEVEPGAEDIRLETEETRLSHAGDYKKLIAIYEDLFGGQALISYYVNENAPQESMFSGPTDDQKKRVENPELLEAICRSLNNLIHPLPPNFIDALIDLLNGKSVAVFDSVSGEFHLFYLAFLHHQLLLRRKAMVICDTEAQVQDVIKQFREIFLQLNRSHEVWQISSVSEMLAKERCDTDILICTEEQLLNSRLEVKAPDFCRYLRHVFIIHAYDIMSRANSFAFRFFDSLNRNHLQFAFLVPENNRDIDSTLEVRLGLQDVQLYNNYNEEAGACILCWRGESYYKTQQAFTLDLHDDFGLAYTISLIAMKNNVSRINLHAPAGVPIKTYAATVKHYISMLAKSYFSVDSISVDSVVVHNPVVAFRERELSFDIFYDEYNNLLNVAMQALTNCAEVTSMVHIISRPYMLRDYFAFHLDKLVHNEHGMQLTVPVYFKELRAPSIALLVRLHDVGMMCEDVTRYMADFGVTGKSVEELLLLAYEEAFGEKARTSIYSFFSFGDSIISEFSDDQYRYTRFLRMTDTGTYERLCKLTENNITVTGAHREVLPISRKCAYNRYLPEQTHVFSGERYEILSVSGGVLNVQSKESVERELEYTQIYDIPYAMLAETPSHTWERNPHYTRDLFRVKVTRAIRGFFAHTNGLDFYGNNTQPHWLNEVIEDTRETDCLRLRLSFPFSTNHDSAAAMMVLLLRGILETAVPKNYPDILVVSRLAEDAFDESLFDDTPPDKLLMRQDPIPNDWLESDDNELPLSQSLKDLFPHFGETNFECNDKDHIDIYLIDFSEDGGHILSGLAGEINRLFNVLYGYLDWVIKNPKLKHSYLRFGYHQIPSIFQLTSVYSWLQNIAAHAPDVAGSLRGKLSAADLTDHQRCSFCGRNIAVSSWQFDDERVMCEECYAHRTNERREVQVLLKQAYQTLEKKYDIKLPEGIKIRFKTATSIKKASGSRAGGRILGFYFPGRREIWVERGGPEPCVIATLMHELTHAWQFANINADKMDLKYIEGHSTYVEIECSRALGQTVYADFWEKSVLAGSDEYAQGLRYWKDRLRVESDKNIFHHIQKMSGEQ